MKYTFFASLTALTLLTGCAEAIFGTAAFVGASSLEERSIGENIDDGTISASITNRFVRSDVANLLTDVATRVHEGRVLLTGRTASPEVAIEAVRLAWQVEGVREVISEIKVGEEGTDLLNYASDNIIEAQIESRLLLTEDIRSVNYTVEVVNGTAYLLGVAQNTQERNNVAKIASLTKGVTKVMSYVRLKDSPQRLDALGAQPANNARGGM